MSDSNVIHAAKPEVIALQTEKLTIPFRGPIESGPENRHKDQVLSDLKTLQSAANVNARATLNYAHIGQREGDTSRMKVQANRASMDFYQKIKAMQGERIGMWFDFHETKPISFVPGSDIARRAMVSAQYGEATIPLNKIESKTYTIPILSEGGLSTLETSVVVDGIFDKGEGDGVVDYEGNGEDPTLEETPTGNLANGQNLEYWRRRAIFDLSSDVTEVEAEITLQLPEQSNLFANVLSVHPFPLGTVDITGLWTSPDLSSSFSAVDGFSELLDAGKTRWLFPTQEVAQVKVRLRQQNWFEENGKKVFEYGMQELGVMLVEWDRHYDAAAASFADNHSFVVRVDALDGMVLNKLHGFYSGPDYLLESAGSRHLHFTIATTADGTNVIWSSDASAAPQALTNPIDLGSNETVYVIVTMNWAETVTEGSPFLARTPPFLNGLGLDVTMVEAS